PRGHDPDWHDHADVPRGRLRDLSEQLVVSVARLALLVLLWIFVFTVAGVIRRDIFAGGRSGRLVAPPPVLAPSPSSGRPAKVKRPTPVPLGVPIRIGRTSLELRP